MPIVKTQGYQLDSPQQNFVRDSFPTLADMLAYDTAMLPPVFHSMVDEDGKLYTYWENNEVDPVLGKWRLGAGGGQGGDTLNVDELPDPSSCQEGDFVNVRADYEKPIYFDVIRDHYGEPYRMVTSKELEDLVKPGNWDYTALQTIDLQTGDWFWELLDENLMNFPIACHWTRGYVTSDGYVYNFTYNETPAEGQPPITFTKDKHPELRYLTEIYLCAVNSEDVEPGMSIISTHNIDNVCFVAGQTLIDPVVPEPEVKQYKAGLYRLVDREWKLVKLEVNVDKLPDPSCYNEGDIVNLNNAYDECITDDVITKKYGWPWRSMSLEEAEVFIKNWTWDTEIIRPNPSVDPIYVIRATRQFTTHIPNFFVDYGEKILTNTFGTFITNNKGTTGRQDLSIVEDDTYPDFYENTLMLAVCDYTQHPEYAAPGVGYFFRYVDTGPGDSEGLCINAQCVAEWNKEWKQRPGPGGGVYERDYYYAYGKEEPFENTEAGEYIVGQSYTYEVRNYEAGVYRLVNGVWVKEEYGKTFDLDELPDPSEYTEGDVINLRKSETIPGVCDTDDIAIKYYDPEFLTDERTEPTAFTASSADFDNLFSYEKRVVLDYNGISGLNVLIVTNSNDEELVFPFTNIQGSYQIEFMTSNLLVNGSQYNEGRCSEYVLTLDTSRQTVSVIGHMIGYGKGNLLLVRAISNNYIPGWIEFDGIYWAPSNVGATCESTRESWWGNLYATATHTPHSVGDPWNDETNYRYYDSDSNTYTKYKNNEVESGTMSSLQQKFYITEPIVLHKAGLYKLINGQWESNFYESESLPIGSIIAFGGINPPIGYLLCNGANISRTLYADLFNAIGTAYGSGDGRTTFTLPDLRESTIVGSGQNTTKTIASHDVYDVGQFRDDQLQGHVHHATHNVDYQASTQSHTTMYTKALRNGWTKMNASSLQSYFSDDLHGTPRIGNNTHGKQTGCNYIIKYCKHVTPYQEAIIDDNTINGNTTWSSLKIKEKTDTWVDISDKFTITKQAGSASYTITRKNAWICGCLVKFRIIIVFNSSGSAGTNPLDFTISSDLFSLEDYSYTFCSSYYGSNIWTSRLDQNGQLRFRPDHAFNSGEDAEFCGLVTVKVKS